MIKVTRTIFILFIVFMVFPANVLADQVHRVVSGENISTIAMAYNLKTDTLIKKNQYLRNPNMIYPGQPLIIPGDYYRVKPGDTLYKISNQLNIPINLLASYNNITNINTLYVGQILGVPIIYTVQAGDTLYKISVKLRISFLELAARNNVEDLNSLVVGQTLIIPNKANQEEDDLEVDRYLTPIAQRFQGIFYFKGPATAAKIAITFDDGPHSIYTNQILDILKDHNIPATFFVLGQNLQGHQEEIYRIINEGHTIGNHTWTHPDLRRETSTDVEKEMALTEQALFKLIGIRTSTMRPPYGFVTDSNIAQLGDLNYKVIKWSVDSFDWRDRDIDKILINILPGIKEGSVLLFHDFLQEGPYAIENTTATAKMLPELIKTLKLQGYTFVTVDDLLGIVPYK